MARIGKIARLPQELREELNRRLADGEAGNALLQWLNGLPAAREVLGELFGGATITKQNLSEWRKGGFREWQTRQDLFSDARKVSGQGQELRQISGDKLTDDLATVLAGQYAMVLNRWLAQPTRELEARLRVLHGLCVDIVALRRGDHNIARLAFDLERWEFNRERMLKEMAAREREKVEGLGESNLVQVKFFSGALGSGMRANAEAGEDSGSAGLLSEIYMFSKAGVSFSVSPGLGWSVGTVARRAVECPVGYASHEAVKTAELQTRHPLTWLKPGVNEKREESCLPPARGEAPGDEGRGESKLVQVKIFSGAAGSGAQTSVQAPEDPRSAGLLSNMAGTRQGASGRPRSAGGNSRESGKRDRRRAGLSPHGRGDPGLRRFSFRRAADAFAP